jgi:hypothetical protein
VATSLRDIPGANRSRLRLRRSDPRTWAPARPARLEFGPRPLPLESGRRTPRFVAPRRRIDVGLWALWLSFAALLAFGFHLLWQATRVHVEAQGIDDGMILNLEQAAALQFQLVLESDEDLARAELTFDGTDILDEVNMSGRTIRWQPGERLFEGEHTLRLAMPRVAFGDAVFSWDVTVDGTAPTLEVPTLFDPVPIDEPVEVCGTVERGADLRLGGDEIDTSGGRFCLDYDIAPAAPLHLEAVDRAGNRTAVEVVVPVAHPAIHGVHVTAAAWRYDPLREGVLALIDAGLIDTVELDLKDEAGVIGYDSELSFAREIGAVRPEYDLSETVELLRERGVRVVGRIVAFRDPILARAAWAQGRRDMVLQTPDGQPLAAYGGFTNYVHPDVRRYNLDIALEAVEMGVHDILWDYVRRPDGDPATMLVPGLAGPSSEAIASFMAETHEALRAERAYQGASVFGIAADRPDAIGQSVPLLARHTDYLAPMIYPSHWVDGEYRVESPIRQPFEITAAALADFQKKAAGTTARLVPWIQDFSLYGVAYGPDEVRAQIEAARSLGIDGFLLWNPGVRYTAEALDPLP